MRCIIEQARQQANSEKVEVNISSFRTNHCNSPGSDKRLLGHFVQEVSRVNEEHGLSLKEHADILQTNITSSKYIDSKKQIQAQQNLFFLVSFFLFFSPPRKLHSHQQDICVHPIPPPYPHSSRLLYL